MLSDDELWRSRVLHLSKYGALSNLTEDTLHGLVRRLMLKPDCQFKIEHAPGGITFIHIEWFDLKFVFKLALLKRTFWRSGRKFLEVSIIVDGSAMRRMILTPEVWETAFELLESVSYHRDDIGYVSRNIRFQTIHDCVLKPLKKKVKNRVSTSTPTE